MQIKQLTFNAFFENTYIVFDETNEAIIIDPGMNSDRENQKIVDFINKNNLKPVKIVNTHCHIDHILGIDFLKETYLIECYSGKNDEYLLADAIEKANMFGLKLKKAPQIDNYISEKDEIIFGNSKLKILDVPGHTSGHIALYSLKDKFVITGDVLFKDTIGRTDLPGGDLDQLLNSIRTKLLSLDDEYTVFAGHGEKTSIGYEKLNNPFL
ncbi:MAG: MBL fold metallo-hydrolase [Bacteroidales bacterium]|nr:MBL fold metallo-hydrolase [Bacteroidales bacterium]